ncbi:nicotinate-nucleotide--dimethylbenzimidazole phosphoribosyltransferase [Clostridium sp. chh4-2]|uniref:nicotinate-nucleotide--dimethylbenzimidazole phosphoribosyltransferase n=1 Tax=Clostridium sp. chh4-2 TaxID=2067550 RepID=UPI001FA876EE|nr:nicotinate-nucleotide--dimethylbenzimidazole phosphoribosyltransferase [Clostridium sp. chh4-2]
MEQRMELEQLCGQIRPLDQEILRVSKAHWDNIAKPLDGLGLLEQMITKIAGIQNSEMISLEKKAVVVMCSDNGVVAEGVTQTDSSVTAVVSENFAKGIASVNRMAAVAGADVIPVDIGINRDVKEPGIRNCKIAYGTKNLAKEPAMTREEALQGILTGIHLVEELKKDGYRILGTGEMGIGNTTTSSAIASVLLNLPPEQVTGKGAGLSKEGIKRKANVIKEAIALHHPDPSDPIGVLAALGGFDIAGMTGLFLGGAVYRVPIVIDGLISSVAALLAKRICPDAAGYMLPSHMSKEPSSERIMEELGLKPVILGQLALGEGTGTVLLFPMLEMANEVYLENSTFENINIEAYQKFEGDEQP